MLRWHKYHYKMKEKEKLKLTVAATKITAFGVFGTGNLVTSVRESTERSFSLTCSSVTSPLHFARGCDASSFRASHAVTCWYRPSQNGTTAECGARNGRVAIGVGWRAPTIAAWTPPILNKKKT